MVRGSLDSAVEEALIGLQPDGLGSRIWLVIILHSTT